VAVLDINFSEASRLFSAGIFAEMSKKGESGVFARLLVELGLSQRLDALSLVRDVFNAVYTHLCTEGNRDEYVYKAALTHKVLLGKHSLNTASMMTEFRVGKSRADIVILNGTATVYEVKSERDSLRRLDSQLDEYRKVFAQVCVLAPETHVDGILAVAPADVGVMCLGKRHRISQVRNPVNNPGRICPIALFEVLRSAEAKQILINLGFEIPAVPNTLLHSVLRNQFEKLNPILLHQEMVKVLKTTRSLKMVGDLLPRLPSSLHLAALMQNVPAKHHENLVKAINTPLSEALNWR
jgi:hypothetical protein